MSYYYKGTPLTSLFAGGGSSVPAINSAYTNFPPILTSPNATSLGVITTDIGYKISGTPITTTYPIIAKSSNYSSAGNFSITIPSWANYMKASITSKKGSNGSTGPSGKTNTTGFIIQGYSCPRNSNTIPYGVCNTNGGPITCPGGAGGAGGAGGPGCNVSIVQPYIFTPGSTLSGIINSNYVSLVYNGTQLIKSNIGLNGTPGNAGGDGSFSQGNLSPAAVCKFTSPGAPNLINFQTCNTGYYADAKGITGNSGSPGTDGAPGTNVTNLAPNYIQSTPSTSNTSSITVYFFKS